MASDPSRPNRSLRPPAGYTYSSYDHITLAGRTLHLQQQWGIPFIAASVPIVFIDAQLAVMIQGTPPTQV